MSLSIPVSLSSQPLRLGLYIVSVPIGNTLDITLRALQVLQHVDEIACEDTRNSQRLLKTYGIKKPLLSCHDHNEQQRVGEVLSRIQGGARIALISDAGTPLISDPGYKIVHAALQANLPVYPIPGVSAAICALSVSGLPSHHFYFHGFLKPKTVGRQSELVRLKSVEGTLIFYEAPHRIVETLQDVFSVLGDRHVVIARELTKTYEESIRGRASDVLSGLSQRGALKGEIVLLVGPQEGVCDQAALESLLAEGLRTGSLKSAVRDVAEMTGQPKNDVYRRALEMQEQMHMRAPPEKAIESV